MKSYALPFLIFFALLFVKCQGSLENSGLEEVSFIEENSVDSNNDYYEDYSDSLITFSTKKKIQSHFTENQIELTSNIYYNFQSKPLFTDKTMSAVSRNVPAGEQVKIISINEFNENKNNIIGDLAEVELSKDKKIGFMRDAFLLPFPLPNAEDTDFLEYSLNHFHCVDSAIFEGAYYGEEEMGYESEYSEDTYFFESDIVVHTSSYYEGASSSIELNMLSMFEALIFSDAIITSYDLMTYLENGLEETDIEFDTDWGASSLIIRHNSANEVDLIEYYFGDGCGEYVSIQKQKIGVKISYGGGC